MYTEGDFEFEATNGRQQMALEDLRDGREVLNKASELEKNQIIMDLDFHLRLREISVPEDLGFKVKEI